MHRAARLIASAIVVGAGIAACLVGPRSASAAEIDLCESDPIITMTLADGSTTQISVDATIQTSSQNVNNVYYDIHVPTTVTGWTIGYTGNLDLSREQVRVTPDAPLGYYISYVTVGASTRVALTATERLDGRATSRLGIVGSTIPLALIKF